jgi:hypothetical protein
MRISTIYKTEICIPMFKVALFKIAKLELSEMSNNQ